MIPLRVDPASLRDARGRLERLAYELTTLHIEIWQVSDTIGGRVLAGELEHFCGTWHGATSRLASDLDGLGRQLDAAAAAYEQLERHVAGSGRHPGRRPGSGSGSGSGTTVIGGSPSAASGSGTAIVG